MNFGRKFYPKKGKSPFMRPWWWLILLLIAFIVLFKYLSQVIKF